MKPRYPSTTAGAAAGAACLFAFFALLSPACMNRPVLSIKPSTKTNFSATIKTQAVDKVVSATDLDGAFQDLVTGIHQYGCGIESQLENWYPRYDARFPLPSVLRWICVT